MMSGPVISFTSDIIASAKARRLSLDHTEVTAINANLNTVATFEGGSVTFALGGRAVDLGEAVETMSAGYGKPVTKPETSAGPASLDLPENATATERAVAKVQAERVRLSGDATAVAAAGNPWSAGSTFNRTAQAVITQKDPALAARLRNEANAQ